MAVWDSLGAATSTLDLTEPRALLPPRFYKVYDFTPEYARVSPDGQLVLLWAQECCAAIARVDGSTTFNIPGPNSWLWTGPVAWAPDSSWVVLSAYSHADSSVDGMYVVNSRDGRVMRRLPRPHDQDVAQVPFGVSNDGQTLFHWEETGRGAQMLKAMPISNDGEARRLTPTTMKADPFTSRLSPQGDRIVFAERNRIWVMRSDGGGLRNIHIGDNRVTDLSWSPDGRQVLAMLGFRWGKLVVIDPTGPRSSVVHHGRLPFGVQWVRNKGVPHGSAPRG